MAAIEDDTEMYSNKSLSEAIRERLFSVEGKNEETLKYPATETA